MPSNQAHYPRVRHHCTATRHHCDTDRHFRVHPYRQHPPVDRLRLCHPHLPALDCQFFVEKPVRDRVRQLQLHITLVRHPFYHCVLLHLPPSHHQVWVSVGSLRHLRGRVHQRSLVSRVRILCPLRYGESGTRVALVTDMLLLVVMAVLEVGRRVKSLSGSG